VEIPERSEELERKARAEGIAIIICNLSTWSTAGDLTQEEWVLYLGHTYAGSFTLFRMTNKYLVLWDAETSSAWRCGFYLWSQINIPPTQFFPSNPHAFLQNHRYKKLWKI